MVKKLLDQMRNALRLRIKDIDFEYLTITVRDGKGEKDRVAPLPKSIMAGLKRQIERVRLLYEDDLLAGAGEVYLPDALPIKYPNAARAGRYGRRHEPDQVDDVRRFHARSRCGAPRADLYGGITGTGDRFVSEVRFVSPNRETKSTADLLCFGL